MALTLTLHVMKRHRYERQHSIPWVSALHAMSVSIERQYSTPWALALAPSQKASALQSMSVILQQKFDLEGLRNVCYTLRYGCSDGPCVPQSNACVGPTVWSWFKQFHEVKHNCVCHHVSLRNKLLHITTSHEPHVWNRSKWTCSRRHPIRGLPARSHRNQW